MVRGSGSQPAQPRWFALWGGQGLVQEMERQAGCDLRCDLE